MTRLARLKVTVTVPDIIHVEPTIRALSTIEDNTRQGIEAEIVVAPNMPLSAEDQRALAATLKQSQDIRQRAEGISTEPPKKEN